MSFICIITIVFYFYSSLPCLGKIYQANSSIIAKNAGAYNIFPEAILDGFPLLDGNYFYPCTGIEADSIFYFFEVKVGEFTDYIIPRYKTDDITYIYTPCTVLSLKGAPLEEGIMPYTYTPVNPFDDEFDGRSYKVPISDGENWLYLGGSKHGFPLTLGALEGETRTSLNRWGSVLPSLVYKGGCCALNKTTKDILWGLPYQVTAYKMNLDYLYFRHDISSTPNKNGNQNIAIDAAFNDIFMRSYFQYIKVECIWIVNVYDFFHLKTFISTEGHSTSCTFKYQFDISSKFELTINLTAIIKSSSRKIWPPRSGLSRNVIKKFTPATKHISPPYQDGKDADYLLFARDTLYGVALGAAIISILLIAVFVIMFTLFWKSLTKYIHAQNRNTFIVNAIEA